MVDIPTESQYIAFVMCLDNKKLAILETGMAKDRWILVFQNPKKQ
jgi:hypothetical protein